MDLDPSLSEYAYINPGVRSDSEEPRTNTAGGRAAAYRQRN